MLLVKITDDEIELIPLVATVQWLQQKGQKGKEANTKKNPLIHVKNDKDSMLIN